MIIPQKYKAINWADGMKVNKDHFIGTENFFADQIRDTASLGINNYNFGMLPPLAAGGAVLSNYILSRSGSNKLHISVNNFHAITPGGVRINVSDEPLEESVKLSDLEEDGEEIKTETTEYYYLVLVVNLHEKVPGGNPDPDEIPIRQPYSKPLYTVQVVPVNSLNFNELGAYHLVIGRVIKNGKDVSRDDSFIPPCTAIISNDKLKQYYRGIVEYMSDIQNLAEQIIQKVNFKDQRAPVAQNVKQLCAVILNYCAEHYFNLKNIIPQQPPVFLIDAMAQFSNKISTYIKVLAESEKEEMLNYFFEWSDVTPVSLTDRLSYVADINYNHHNNGEYFTGINAMLNNILVILQRLNTLEYIGLKKENIVVKEEVLTRANKDKKGWNILD